MPEPRDQRAAGSAQRAEKSDGLRGTGGGLRAARSELPADRWLVLIHQLPPKPDYLRVKISRRLQRIGAVAIKNTVYVMPATDQALEDLQWTMREIREAGGDANLCQASFVDGLTDGDIQQRFNDARDAEYAPLLTEARALRRAKRDTLAERLADLRRRAAEVQANDFFGARNGQALMAELDEAAKKLTAKEPKLEAAAEKYRGRTWVTRTGVHVDRMASAWLIRRFIDPKAKFRFVLEKTAKRSGNEIWFDMFEADFTHDGNRCTFEVLLDRALPGDDALRTISEIVHDIDLREQKFGRDETAGIAAVVNGIALAHRDDRVRIERASAVFDDLYDSFRKRR
jgi:hypothetical protein